MGEHAMCKNCDKNLSVSHNMNGGHQGARKKGHVQTHYSLTCIS